VEPEPTSPTTFLEIAHAWLDEVRRTRRPKTAQSYEIAVSKLLDVIPDLATRPLTRADLVAFRDWRASQVSVISANRDVKAIKACLAWAEIAGLGHPPAETRRLLLPPPPRRDQTLTPDQVDRLLEAAQFDLPVLVVLRVCAATGFRLGEALSLTWADVDPQSGAISVTPKPWWRPKTRAAVRTVYAPELVTWLTEFRSTLRHRRPTDRVCQQDPTTGKAWTTTIHVRLQKVAARAGLAGVRPTHALRHTLASDLVQSGAPIHVAQKLLGHSSPTVTLGVYAHAQRDGLEQAGRALESWRKRSKTA
jgi:integrase